MKIKSAAQAYNEAMEVNDRRAQEEYVHVAAQIDAAIQMGNVSTTISGSISPELTAKLTNHGYKVSSFDARNETSTTIAFPKPPETNSEMYWNQR